MDKLLLDALNNLSLSLENLTLALQQKSDAKSDVAGALSSGDISKKLDQILSILQSNPPKTNPNLPTPAIVPVSKSIISPAPGTFVKKPEIPVVKPPVSGIQEPRETGPSFKEFSRKYLDKDQKREAEVKSKSQEVVREQTSISSPEEKKPLSIKDRISNIFSRKKEEPVKAEDVNKPLTSTKTEAPSIKGPLSVILIGPKSILDWFDSQQKKADISTPLKTSQIKGDSGIVPPTQKTDSDDKKPVFERVKNFFMGRKSEPVKASEMSTGSPSSFLLKGPLSVILVGPRSILDWFDKQQKILNVTAPFKSIPGKPESGIVSPSDTKPPVLRTPPVFPPRNVPPPIVPATSLTPVPPRPAPAIIPPVLRTPPVFPPRNVPPPIVPATSLTPVPPRPAPVIPPVLRTPPVFPPRNVPPAIIPATSLTPVPPRPAPAIIPPVVRTPVFPPRNLPPPIVPATSLTPVPPRPVPAIIPPVLRTPVFPPRNVPPPIVPATSLTPVPPRPAPGIVPPVTEQDKPSDEKKSTSIVDRMKNIFFGKKEDKKAPESDPKVVEQKVIKVQEELDSIVKEIDDIIDSKGPSFTNIIKVSKLAAEALKKEKELKKLKDEIPSDSKVLPPPANPVLPVSASGIVPPRIVPPAIVPATPLTPVPSRPVVGIVPPRIVPPAIVPATPLTPVPSRPAAGIVPPRIVPPTIVAATPLTPVPSRPAAGIVPPRIVPPAIVPATPLTPVPSRPAAGIVPPRIVPPTIVPATPLTPVPSRPAAGIVPPRIVPPTIVAATPLTPVPSRPAAGIVPPSITNVKLPDSDRRESSGNLPRIVTNISPVRREPDIKPVNQKPIETVRPMGPVKNVLPVSVSGKNQPQIRPVPAQTPGNLTTKSTSPFVMGAPYMTMPVIPVAVVSFADGSTLLASSGQSRVMGKKAPAKEDRRSAGSGVTSSRPSTETASKQEDRSERRGFFSSRKSPAETMSRPSTETTSKEVKSDKGGPLDSNKRGIADGVKLLLLMAVGIVAIGLAFKVVGGIDFKSVLALAIALPLVAIAFEKISKVKVTPREMAMTSLALIVMAGAILVSSFLLSKVRPIGLDQAFSSVVIAGIFALVARKMPAIFEGIKSVGLGAAIVGSLLLPVVMVALSYAIMKSSDFIRRVKPIGLQQAFSTVIIAGMFAIVGKRIPPILEGIKSVGLRAAIVGSLLLPVVMVALSYAIMKSSDFIRGVKPIGIQQAFSTIVIAGTFAIISLSLGKLLRSFDGLNPGSAIVASLLMPIVLVGVSYAIMKSSDYIRRVKPIGLQQAFSSIIIAGVFALVGFGIGKLMKAFDKVNPAEAVVFALVAPIILIGISYAIMKSSNFISKTKPVGWQNFFAAVMISIVFIVLSFGLKKMFKGLSGISSFDIIKAAVFLPPILIALSWAIMKSSPFISNTKPVGYQNFFAAIMISIVFIVMSFAAKFIVQNTKNISAREMVKGGLIVVAMAVAVLGASYLIKLLPEVTASQFGVLFGVLGSLVGMAVVGLALSKIANRIDTKDFIKGSLIVLGVATTIMMTSLILALGNYSGLPEYQWILKSATLVTVFGLAIFAAAKLNQRVGFRDMIKGGITVVMIATTIMLTSLILSGGKYNKYPNTDWVKYTAFVLVEFGAAVFIAAKMSKAIGLKDLLKGALIVVVIAAAIMVTSLVLGLGKYDKYPSTEWAKGVGLSLLIFGIATASLGAAIVLTGGLGLLALGAGILAVVSIAASIVATSELLAKGNYGVFPTDDWISGVAKTLLLFGTAVVTLGAIAAGGAILEGITFGLVQNPLDAGIDAVRKVSELVVETSNILAGGNYSSYPTNDWISGVAKTLLLFGTAVVSLGALSSGGGALEGISFGLVKNPITAGVEALLAISKTIVDADNILGSGKFTGGPSVEWSKGIGLALGSFSQVYEMILNSQILSLFSGGKVGGGMDTFTTAIYSISYAIKTAGNVLSSATFTGGPKEEWARSVGIAIGAFSEVYDMIERSQVLNFFSRGNIGVSVESFSAAITSLSTGIATAAKTLGGVKFEGGPKEEWAKAVGLSIGAFSEVYDMLQDQKIMDLGGKIVGKIGKLFGGSGKAVELGVGVTEFGTAIDTISAGLKKAAENLKASDDSLWKGGPSETWAKGVGNAIGGFAPVFTAVSESVGLFPGPDIEQFKNAIVTISNGIIEAAGVFNGVGEGTIFDLNKAPKAEWGENVGKAIAAFTPVFQYLSDNTGWYTKGPEAASDLQFAIKAVSEAIKQSSIELAGGNYTTKVEDTWVKTINTLMTDYVKLFENVDTDQEDMTKKSMSLGVIASSIKNTSTTLSLGKYDTVFGDKWNKTVNGLFNDYIKLLDKVDTDSKEMESKTNSLSSIATSIKATSITLSLGKFDKVFGKFGSEVENLMSSFISIFKKIDKSESDFSKKSSIIDLSNIIKQVSDVLSKVSMVTAFDSKYPKVVSDLFESYLKVFKRVKDAKLDFKNVEIINQVAKSFARISVELSKGKYTITVPDNYFKNLAKNVDNMMQIIKKLKGFKIPDALGLNVIIDQIKSSSNKLSKIKFTGIPESWADKLKKTVLDFGSIITEVDKKFGLASIKVGTQKIDSILGSMVKSSLLISAGKYTNIPSSRWISIVGQIAMRIGQVAVDVDKKFGMIGLKTGLSKIKSISETIRDVSNALTKGSYKVFPTDDWAKGVSLSLQGFLSLKLTSSSLVDTLLGKTQALDKKKLAGVLDLIMMVDKTFSKGQFKNFPSMNWASGVISSLSKFSTIMSAFDFRKMNNKMGTGDNLSKMTSNIEVLARAFDRLATSLQKFTSSIGTLDTKKLESIRTLTSNVVLLSLMDASQFDRIMTKLEERSDVFGSILSDRGGSKSSRSGGISISTGSSDDSKNSVSVKGISSGPQVNQEALRLNQMMESLLKLIGGISNVVGPKGKLSEFLEDSTNKTKGYDWQDLSGSGLE